MPEAGVLLVARNSYRSPFLADKWRGMSVSPRTNPLVLLACGSLALSQGLVAQGVFGPTTPQRQEARQNLKPLPENRVVSYKTIAGDFSSDQQAALGKYGGRRITVIGRVAALSQGSSENKILVVTLQDPSASLPAVKAQFLLGSIPENSELEISSDGSQATLLKRDRSGMILGREPYLSLDQRVGIKGSFKEIKVGDIVLGDCQLLPKTKLREIFKKD